MAGRKKSGRKAAPRVEDNDTPDEEAPVTAGKDRIIGGLYEKGKAYGPGKEAALKALKLPAETLQRLADKGHIVGFGTKASTKAAKAAVKARSKARSMAEQAAEDEAEGNGLPDMETEE